MLAITGGVKVRVSNEDKFAACAESLADTFTGAGATFFSFGSAFLFFVLDVLDFRGSFSSPPSTGNARRRPASLAAPVSLFVATTIKSESLFFSFLC